MFGAHHHGHGLVSSPIMIILTHHHAQVAKYGYSLAAELEVSLAKHGRGRFFKKENEMRD